MKREMKKEMIDNRRVKDDHQEGIARVLQRKSEKDPARPCSGKMGEHHGSEKRDWDRDHGSMTPKKA